MNRLFIFAILLAQTFISNAQDYVKFEDKGKVGFKNKSGIVVIPATFDGAWAKFSKGLVGVKKGSKWGYIDSTGRLVIPYKYDEVSEFLSVGLALVFKEDKKLGVLAGYIDVSGKEIVPVIYESGMLEFNNGNLSNYLPYHTFKATRNGKSGILDVQGKIKIPLIYDNIEYVFPQSGGGFFIVEKNHKFGSLDENNNVIIPLKYDFISYSSLDELQSGKRLKIKLNGKEGYVDFTGKAL